MKWWLPGGLSVLLGCGAAAAWAEELEFRPVGSAPVPNVVRTNSDAASRPGAPGEEGTETPSFRPVSLARPVPVVRAQKADQEVPQPLPAGPALFFAQDKKEPVKASDPKKSNVDPPVEIVPIKPRVLNSAPPATMFDDNCGVSSVCPTYVGGRRTVMGDCCEIIDPCCDICAPSPCAMDLCACCAPRSCFWLRAEYLAWMLKSDHYPTLVTAGDTRNQAVLGEPGTRILLDDSTIGDRVRSGARFTAGFWLPHMDCLGIEASYFFLGQENRSFHFGAGDGAVIGRPFTEVNPGVQNPPGSGKFVPVPFERVEFVRFPGFLEGNVRVDTYSRMWGAELNLRSKLCCNECSHLDVIFGYRHFQLSEGIRIRESLETLPTPGTQFIVTDRFDTRNTFDGGQIGLDGEWRFHPRWSVSAFAKIAAGTVKQQVRIQGDTFFSDINQTLPGGLLAATTNIGTHERNRFAVMPEAGLRINYDLTDHLRLYAGYNFMYLSSAVRPGEQIDTTVNSGFIPRADPRTVAVQQGPSRPSVLFKTSDFWAQGLNFGMEYHW